MLRPIPASRPNALTNSPLDRAAERRRDTDWIAARLADPDTVFVPVRDMRHLMRGLAEGAPRAVYWTGATLGRDIAWEAVDWAFLGLRDERPVFALAAAATDPPDGAEYADLWQVGQNLPEADLAILGHARGMLHWRARHRFCGVCGARCEARDAGHVMACPSCGATHFPRTDPAVIMLVTRGDLALLGNAPRFREARMYSTLAGFVEPGESLEEAVRREVFEETGVRVGAVWYHSSQPWPFPASIMLGFHAETGDETIVLDREELADARWFSRDELRDPRANDFRVPPPMSIARRLIEDWLAA